MDINKLVNELVHRVVTELKQDHIQKRIKTEAIDPLVYYTFQKLYPYIVVLATIFFLTFIFAMAILFLVIQSNVGKKI